MQTNLFDNQGQGAATEPPQPSKPGNKKCSGCEQWKSLEDFSIAKRGLYGRASRCKACRNAEPRVRRKDGDTEEKLVAPVTGKVCTKCGEWKILEDYTPSKKGRFGRCSRCKKCACDYQKVWNKTSRSKEARRDYERRYWAASTSRKKKWRENRQLNEEKARLADPLNLGYNERARYRYAANIQDNRLTKRIANHKRRLKIREQSSTGTPPTAEWWKEFVLSNGGRCLCCGASEKLEMDHVIPLSKGGLHDIDNIQILCRSCNSRKQTKIIDYRPCKGGAILKLDR